MDRQSSFGSASSAGSAFTSQSATTKLVNEAEKNEGALDTGGHSLLTALFGALYTLAKEKINDSANVAMLAIWVDFLMIFTLLLMPEYPWKADKNLWLYNVFYYIQIHLPIADKGYMFYLIIFYILVAVLFISTAICIWVGWCFMNDNFPFLWPIKVARVVVSLFVSMFYIASLNIFLVACSCKKVDGVWKHLVWKDLECLGFPHLIHAAFSVTSGVVFFVVAFLLVLGDHELEPMTKSLLAAPHSMCELRALLCKTLITFADILLKPMPKVQVVLYTISCGLLFYYHARMVPHYVPWINVLRGGLNAVLAWVAFMACVLSYTVHWEYDDAHHPHWDRDDYRHSMTVLMAVGVPVVFAAGAGVCWWHLVYAWRTALKFKQLPAGVKPRTIHRFMSEFDVEIASRVGRVWDEEGVPDPTALGLAENVLRAGVMMKPNSVFLHIAYSNLLIECRHNNASGWSMLEQARKLGPNLSYQFSIFTRGQEHKQKSAGGGGGEEGQVDLVSYVEFQKNYKALMVYHKASLVATRDFWRHLTRDAIYLDKLGHSFERMDEMEFMADKTYKLVLDRYPTNAKLLKSYGKFLEHVKNNPWGAARYYAEAEKQEELAENAAAEVKISAFEGLGQIDDATALITINAEGIIQITNKAAGEMFGYKKGELEGKNISVLMPPPFSLRHNSYLRNYTNSGKAKILDSPREVVGLHTERYVFPIALTVTKVSGSGADALFMGMLKVVPTNPKVIQAWLLTSGTMLCADRSFVDYAGWTAEELVGKSFSSLGTDSSELDDLIAQCAAYNEQQLAEGAVQVTTSIKHKYAEDVPVHIKFEMGGTEDQRLLVVKMTRLAEVGAMAAFDHKGAVLYANTPLAAMLGYELKVLRTKDISQLLPMPFGMLHHKWIKDAASVLAKPSAGGCRSGLTTIINSSNGTPIYVKTQIIPHTNPGASYFGGAGGSGSETIYAVKVERSTAAALHNERRLSLLLQADGTIVWSNQGTPQSLFGLDPTQLTGRKLDECIDVFAEFAAECADMQPALAALMSRNSFKSGCSWRVAVGDIAADRAAAAEHAAANAAEARIMLQRTKHKSKLKPAIMTVTSPSEDNVPEEVLPTLSASGAVVLMELWRAEMLLGIAEVVEGGTLTRVEPSVGMLFGTPHTSMLNSNLSEWLNISPGVRLDDLLGTKGQKKGGMRALANKVGHRRLAAGVHTDQRPVSVALQACVKETTGQDDKVVLVLRLMSHEVGLPGLLQSLVTSEAEGTSYVAGAAPQAAAGELIDLSTAGGGGLTSLSGAAGASGVPELNMQRVGVGAVGDLMGANTHRDTHRSNGDGSAMATARLVSVELGGARQRQGRAPADLAGSPTSSDGGWAGQVSPHKQPRGRSGREEEDGGYAAGREMDISSDDGSSAHGKGGKVRRHLTEEEKEAAMANKGARKAREWLDSGFGGFKQQEAAEHNADGAVTLPGAVEDTDRPLQLVQRPPPGGEGQGDAGAAGDHARGEVASESSNSMAGDGGLVSDYSRGKRLRKLTRLLSSKAALQVVTGFRLRLVLLAAAILVLHVGSFGVMTGMIAKESGYLVEIGAAGEVINAAERLSTLAVVLEAAQRSYRFRPADIRDHAAELSALAERYEQLHQGLYLGFDKLRRLDTPRLYSLWHEPGLTATTFTDTADPLRASTSATSLFTLGSMVAAAAKDIAFAAAAQPDAAVAPAGLLSRNRQWQFLQANVPGQLYKGYLSNLNLMVVRAQVSLRSLQYACLALLLIEGFCIIVVAVLTVMRLLRGISVHRQALFSVFLAIPHGYLRNLASKSVSIGDEDADEDDDADTKLLQQQGDAAKQKKKAKSQHAASEDGGDGDGDKASKPGGSAAPIGSKKQRKASFSMGGAPEASEATVVVTAAARGPNSGKETFGGPGKPGCTASDRSKLFHGKELVTSASSAYQLSWPFALWGLLVVVLYAVSWRSFAAIDDDVINIKMVHRSRAQASRVVYFAARTALAADASQRSALQPLLLAESERLEEVYSAALYGANTLADSVADGSVDKSRGCLFAGQRMASLLFGMEGCIRDAAATCLTEASPYYAVGVSSADAQLSRLIRESHLLGLDDPASLSPDNIRFGYVWDVAWIDLNKRLDLAAYEAGALAMRSFMRQRTTQIILLMVMFVAGSLFLLAMLRPFLKHISKESRRCAELLAQLPPDMDVEGMVAATWSVVKQERIIAERSGKSFIDSMGAGTTSMFSRLSFSMGFGRPQQLLLGQGAGGAVVPFGRSRFGSGASVEEGEEEGRLFNRRQTGPGAGRRSGDMARGAYGGGYGGQRGGPPAADGAYEDQGGYDDGGGGGGGAYRGYAGGGRGSSGGGRGGRQPSVEGRPYQGGPGGGGGGEALRHRGSAGGQGRGSPSRRAVAPADDDY